MTPLLSLFLVNWATSGWFLGCGQGWSRSRSQSGDRPKRVKARKTWPNFI